MDFIDKHLLNLIKVTGLLVLWFGFSPLVEADTVVWTETFETGLPATASSAESNVTLSSGIWKASSVYGKSDNGSTRACMSSTGAYLVAPAVDKPTLVTFNHRSSGNYKILTVEKSVNNGTSWSTVGTVSAGSASTYGSASMSVNEPGTKGVLLRFVCGGATIYLDNISVLGSEMGDEPTLSSTLTGSDSTGTSVKINFTKGNGSGRLLVCSKESAVTWIPSDGTAYTNLPKQLETNVTGICSGNADSVVVTGLLPGTTYHFAVFEYNGVGTGCNYLTSNPGRLEIRTLEVPGISIGTASIGFGSLLVNTTDKRSFSFTASYLQPASDTITLTCPEPFRISKSLSTGYSDILKIPYDVSKLDSTTIYVQFQPSTIGYHSVTLHIAGGGASTGVLLTGTGSLTASKTYFIAPTGNDSGDGSFESPWYNLQKAVDVAVAGDSIVCRGGIYYPTMMKSGSVTTIRLATSGNAGKRISIVAYPGEFPVMNFKSQAKMLGIRGVLLTGDYWYIRGIHFTEAGDNGIKVEGNHNLIEKCTFSYNDDSGMQLGFGHDFSVSGFGSSNDGSHCAYNDIVDCDAYLNCDADNFGSDADGFACKMHNGLMNRFIRCRSWDNADDGWDLYETDFPVYLLECWAWGSGRAENFTWVSASGSFQGNGNGIKMGGNGTGGSSQGKHEAYHCVAFNCNKTGSVKGFDQNSHTDGVKLVNCLAFGCGYDFMFEKNSNDCEYYNNVCFGNIEISAGSVNSNNAMLSTSTEAWSNTVGGFSYSDYVSLTETDAKAARGTDGSMPGRFARLVSGSVLVDKGIYKVAPFITEFPFIGQPVYGNARDLGPYELQEGGLSAVQMLLKKSAVLSLGISNISSIEAQAHFSTGMSGIAKLTILGLNGQLVAVAWNGKVEAEAEYDVPIRLDGLPNGFYLCRLTIGNCSKTCKLMVNR
jgi:pectate disaccharide-lyase